MSAENAQRMGGMAVELNHTIVWCRDKQVLAAFLSGMLGLAAPVRFGPFLEVQVSNNVILAYHETDEEIMSQHYAFLISEAEFDRIFGRIEEQGLEYWADPAQRHAGEINHDDGGRGVYFSDPDGHFREIIPRPYGS